MAHKQTDIIAEARANLAKIDKEIEAAREQVHSLNEKIENLQKTKAQDEALIRIVDMHAQGKDLSALLNPTKPTARNSTRRERDPNEPRTVREGGSRGPSSDKQGVIDAARALLAKEGSLTRKDIAQHVMSQGIQVSGKDEEAQVRNVTLIMERNGDIFRKDRGMFRLA